MKKNVLALSITAALIGLTGGAHAMTGPLGGAGAGSTLALNGDGVGHSLFVPYFTTQGNNATLISIVNTDETNGKAVKVRFRGAANSDDIFDFQVFLSPGDVWTANVSQGANGKSVLTSTDASCTKPQIKGTTGGPFVSARLDSTMTADGLANGTREGYIEIFNMADIPMAGANTTDSVAATAAGATNPNPLYTAIKHVKSVAPCSGAAWDALNAADGGLTAPSTTMTWGGGATTSAASYGLLPPTTGLMANWTIINTVSAAAWSGEATAIQAVDVAGAPTTGNVVYWPQTAVKITNFVPYSADPLLQANLISGAQYDLPDLSTPYTLAGATPETQAAALTASIAATAARNEFFTGVTAAASTDLVFSMPTRRYAVAYDYSVDTAVSGAVYNAGNAAYFAASNIIEIKEQSASGTNGNGRQLCVKDVATPIAYDREENKTDFTPGGPEVVFSPNDPIVTPTLSLCGEAAVYSINNGGITAAGTGSLKASVAVKDLDYGTITEGWLTLLTPGATGIGLPVVGSSFVKASSSDTQSFGLTNKHRFVRP